MRQPWRVAGSPSDRRHMWVQRAQQANHFRCWQRVGWVSLAQPILHAMNDLRSDASRATFAAGLIEVRAIAVIKTDLSDVYRDYIACLNKQDWPKLGQFVDDEVIHNGRRLGLSGYPEMLERDFDETPDRRQFWITSSSTNCP